ncbi:MAG: helix-turn-helix domain-containing protein [Lachnospiraceae bacterium]
MNRAYQFRIYPNKEQENLLSRTFGCCRCGRVKKELKLSERIYRCECGSVMDRDKNAAVNIREEARRMLTA